MHPRKRHPSLDRQRGAALMVMLVILVLGLAATLVSSLNSASLRSERQAKTAAALAQARDALIGYAITYGDTHPGAVHGYLPCPNQAGGTLGATEGIASVSCGGKNISQIGRLPWKTLDLPPLRDGNGECLWYAVSGAYKNNTATDLMNWDTNGQLQVYASDGTTLLTPADNQAVAVIFAPGVAQNSQARTADASAPVCGGNYTASNYLDSDGMIDNAAVSAVANAISKFRLGTAAGINDQMLFITRQDIWNAIQKRNDFRATLNNMTQSVAKCIAAFGAANGKPAGNPAANKSLPWPAPLSLADYGRNLNYDDQVGLYSGRVPYRVNDAYTTTGNTMSNYNLLVNATNCPTGWAEAYPWWTNWKDHLFYALSREYRPGNLQTAPCGDCLSVNGSGPYAAVVMFAGSRLSGQVRASSTTDAQRAVITNYLEGRNAGNHPNSGGDADYQSGTASATFNDTLYCIDTNLNVAPCP
ncbi:hypothetical protein FGKAn22_18940 [Ferrigenium kumadai]|uniref:Uncharacterized protein n=1 Tax=Ferrigenium kumadai TaxID=1682490 RepID=A0AAN1T0V3_9PROT|nr:hypothetical protein [Ferrigenium kumadai]BBJ00202.1 hypothetical protein FGKAn22_18940 [Ferrigenium kumadai]